MKFSRENFHGGLHLKHLSNAIIWSLIKYSWKNFRGTIENRGKRESLAQWIFPRLRHVATQWDTYGNKLYGVSCLQYNIRICDQIWEKVHSSHIRFWRSIKAIVRVEIYRDDRGIVVLQFLKFSHLSNIPNNRFYESLKLKNWMCELYTFSQIGHILWFYVRLYVY